MNEIFRVTIFMLSMVGARADVTDPVELKPTRVRWCESLLSTRDRAPAEAARLARVLATAEARVTALLTARDSVREDDPHPAELAGARPNLDPVAAGLRHRTEAEATRQLRQSKGRLARMNADLGAPDVLTLARVDRGVESINEVLDLVPRRAWAAERATGASERPPPIAPEYALRSIAGATTLGCVTFGCTLEMVNSFGTSDKIFAFFLGGTIFAGKSFVEVLRSTHAEFKSPAARIRLENTYDPNRIGDEADAFERLRHLTGQRHPSPRFFAHHGYALFVPERTRDDLLARLPDPAPVRRRLLRLGREPAAVFVDHVLFLDDQDQKTMVTTLRFADVPVP